MNHSNISQIIIRNIHLLNSKTPLFVNLPCDTFIDEFLSSFPNTQLTSFNNNFQEFGQHQNKKKYPAYFDADYSTTIKHDLVLITYPKVKSELNFILEMLAPSLTEDAEIIIVGEKNGGIKSSEKQVSSYISHYRKHDSARHCMLYSGQIITSTKPFNLDDWYQYYDIAINGINVSIASLPGVFSQKKLDQGTHVLLNNLPEKVSGQILDFGCGAGVIATYVAKKYDGVELHLTDVSALALKSAEKTLNKNGFDGKIFPTDSLTNINGHYQTIFSNPPFHQGIKTHYEATETFLSGIKQHINKKGTLVIVANSFLQYEPILKASFKDVSIKTKDKGFSIYYAINY